MNDTIIYLINFNNGLDYDDNYIFVIAAVNNRERAELITQELNTWYKNNNQELRMDNYSIEADSILQEKLKVLKIPYNLEILRDYVDFYHNAYIYIEETNLI